ncbi:MAG: hypothetical protein ACI865_001752 [Flavobacteriaceae bacterium]|jgi:hypothetical protein
MYSMKVLIGIIAFFSFGHLMAQEEVMATHENDLVVLLDQLRSSEGNAEKEANNTEFTQALKSVLENRSALTYNFTKLTTVGFIDSPDELVRIVNWNVEQDDKTQRYFGYVLHYDKRKKRYNVTELIEDQYGIKQPDGVVTSDKWYGALYYKIIPVKRGSKTVYTLLGWDGNTSMSNIKLVDAMYVTGKTVKFGSPIFKIGKDIKKRLFYEHSEKITMILRYEDKRNRIMMDHLSPESPSMRGYFSFYVPDLSYDALKFESGKWILHEDVIGVNDSHEDDKQIVYARDPRTGKLKKQVIERKWQNPEDLEAPAGGNEHVAVTPEGEEKDEKKDNRQRRKDKKASDPNLPEYDKKDKRDPSNISFYKDLKKNKRANRRKKRKN